MNGPSKTDLSTKRSLSASSNSKLSTAALIAGLIGAWTLRDMICTMSDSYGTVQRNRGDLV